MPLPTMTGTDFKKELIEEGNYMSALIRVYHIGKFESSFVGDDGKKKDPQDKLILAFEVDCPLEDDSEKNHVVYTNDLTASIGERANLGKMARDWLGNQFNPATFRIEDMLDRPCKIYLSHETSKKGNVFVSIDKIKPAPRDFRPKMNSFWWSITDDLQLTDTRVPAWIKNKAKLSIEGVKAGHIPSESQAAYEKLDSKMADQFDATRVSGHAVNTTSNGDDIPF